MKVILRHFKNSDSGFIRRELWQNTKQEEVAAMITEWDTLKHDGSYFEMFAIEADSELAGYVSLYERKESTVTVGADIVSGYRRKGVAYAAITEALRRARESGYKKADARVRKDNTASLRLCEKLGFVITDEDVTAQGREVYNLEKDL